MSLHDFIKTSIVRNWNETPKFRTCFSQYIDNFLKKIIVVESWLKMRWYKNPLDLFRWSFVIPDFAWKTKKNNTTKTHPNTKFLPVFNGRNKKVVRLCSLSYAGMFSWSLEQQNKFNTALHKKLAIYTCDVLKTYKNIQSWIKLWTKIGLPKIIEGKNSRNLNIKLATEQNLQKVNKFDNLWANTWINLNKWLYKNLEVLSTSWEKYDYTRGQLKLEIPVWLFLNFRLRRVVFEKSQ